MLFGLLVAVVVLAVALFDWNLFKGYVERRVSVATGREFHLDGDLDVRVSTHPLITMDGLRLGNIKGAQDATMASVQRLQFRIALWPLLHGQTILPEVHLVRPVVLLEKNADGSDNWTFPGSGSNPIIRQFTIDHGELTYREDAVHTNLVVDINSDKPVSATQLAPLLFQGKGTYRNNPFALQGRADSPLDLGSTATPYRIDIGAVAGPTSAHASGALRNPLQVTGFELDFTLAGPDLGLLYKLIGIATPETPAYRLSGRLGHLAHVWSFDRFTGVVGNSDLAGDLSVDDNGSKKFLKTALVSQRLDVHDLAGFVGAPAHANPAKAATPMQQAEAEKALASTRLLPQQPYDLGRIRSMDADVSLRAQKVIGTRVPLNGLDAHMLIRDGVVTLDPFDFGAADGKVVSKIRLDASRPVIAAAAKIRLSRVDLGKLIPEVAAIRHTAGKIGAIVDLKGNGNSVAKMLATSNGRLSAGMGGGKISDLLMADAGLNIARIIKLKISGDHDIQIRCVVTDFVARDGIWTTSTFMFDSTDTVIRGSGDIDLRDEQFNLLLKVKPKGRSVLSLRSPLRATGSFEHASIRPDLKALGLRGAAVVLLAAIAPPAAELGLIDLGGGKDSDCVKPDVIAK
jgi:uncharacterized protein involved in outer membrane biogenesis